MPATATQSAPQLRQTAQGSQRAPQGQRQGGAPEKAGLAQKLHALPQSAGIAIMALLLVLSLFIGNARALQRATPANFMRQSSVASIVKDRAAQAENAVSVAQRAFEDGPASVSTAIDQVKTAVADFKAASTVEELSRADQTLTSAVSELASATNSSISGEDAQMLRRALDNFAEQGSFLRQEGRAYNAQAEKARALYERLPARFLLKQPGIYEGI